MLGLSPLDAAPLAALDVPLVLIERPGAPFTTLLAEIVFTEPSLLTLRVSDRFLSSDWTGDEWLPLVAAYGELAETTGGAPGSGELSLCNTRPVAGKPRFSDLIKTPANATGTYELVGAQVTLSRLPRGSTQPAVLGVLVVDDVPDVDERVIRLRLRDASLRLEHQAPLTIVDRTTFPSCARDLPGTAIPLPFGTFKGVPARPIIAGTSGKLVADLSAAATTFSVTAADGSDLDATDFASKVLLLDFEQISFTTRVGNVISGATRAAGAVGHAAGAPALEVLSTYVYAVGEHAAGFPIASVTNVLATGPRSAAPTITLDHVIAGKHFATISYAGSALESLKPVTSAPISVAIAEYQANLVSCQGSQADASATRVVAVPAALAYCQQTRRSVTINASRGGGGGNTVGIVHLTIARGLTQATSVVIFDYTWTNGVIGNVPGGHVLTYDDAVTAETLFINYHMDNTLNGGTIGIIFTPYTVTASEFPLRPGGAYASAVDEALGPVSCDVVGICDDSTGSVSGHAALVLENPADIVRYLLTQFYPPSVLALGGATFATARADLAARGIRWALLYGVDGPVALSDLRDLAGRQMAGALYVEGSAWKLRVAEAPIVLDQTLDYRRDVWDARPAIATRTPSSDIFTSVHILAQWDYLTSTWRLATDVEAPGVEPVQRTLELPWVQDAAVAQALGAYWLAVWQRARWEIELVGWTNLLARRLGDAVAFDGHPILAAHGGAALAFTIVEHGYLLGDANPARIRLRLVEAEPYPP